MVANNILYQRLKHYDHESSNYAVRNNFSVSIRCAIFLSQLYVQESHTGFIQTFHTLQNLEMLKKLYVKLCQDALPLKHFFSTAPSCVGGSPALQHQSLFSYQLQAAGSRLFPDVPFSTWTFPVVEQNLFFWLPCSKR